MTIHAELAKSRRKKSSELKIFFEWHDLEARASCAIIIKFGSLSLLFFVVYVIYKRNYSFSRVVQLFFQTKTGNSFYSKINDSGSLRATRLSRSRVGVRVTALPKVFTIYSKHFSIPKISETLRGSPTKTFCLTVPRILILPLLIHKLIRYRKLSDTQHRRVPLQSYSVLPEKKFCKKSWHNPPKYKIFRYPKSMTP